MPVARRPLWAVLMIPSVVWLNVFVAVYWLVAAVVGGGAFVALGFGLVACWGVHRQAARMEGEGRLRYLKTPASLLGMRNAATELDRIIHPAAEYRVKADHEPVRLDGCNGE